LDTDPIQKSNSNGNTVSWLLALITLFAIVGIESCLNSGINPAWGVLAYGILLTSLLIFAALKPEDSLMLIGLSAIPIIQIIAYGIPYSSITMTVQFGITGFILLFYIIPALRIPEVADSKILKPPDNWLTQILIILSGAAIGYCQFYVYPQATLRFTGAFESTAFIISLALMAFSEEVVFRGMVLSGFVKRFNFGMGIVLAALVYTSLFIPYNSIELGMTVFLTSLWFGFAALKSSGLFGVIGGHFVSSIFYYLILPAILH